jgi:hypothetical protein
MKDVLSAEAIRILRGVQVRILREPELYDQWIVASRSHTCKSPCCFSGHAAFVKGGEKLFDHYLESWGEIAETQLAEILGVSSSMADELFSEWPEKDGISAVHRGAWEKPMTMEAAIDGAKYIDEFIAKYEEKS